MSINDLPHPEPKGWMIRRKSGFIATIAIGLVLALLTALPATAQDYKKGRAAAKRGDYATALKVFKPLAEKGNALAQHALGNLYTNGRGVPRNDAEAVKWWRKAAKAGHNNARYLLGAMYTKGRSVPRDEAEAAKWFRQAADGGHARAQYELGIMYAKGWGVPQDQTLAHMWFSLSATKDNKHGSVDRRIRIARSMSPTQIAKAKEMQTAWVDNQNKIRLARALARKNEQERLARVRLANLKKEKLAKERLAKAKLEKAKLAKAKLAKAKLEKEKLAKAKKAKLAKEKLARAKLAKAKLAKAKKAKAKKAKLAKEKKDKLAKEKKSPDSIKKAPRGPLPAKSPGSEKTSAVTLPAPPAQADLLVQLGALKSKASAQKEAVRLTRAHKAVLEDLQVALVPADLGKRGIYYRLVAGPLSDRATAASLCHKLSARKQDCIVIKPWRASEKRFGAVAHPSR